MASVIWISFPALALISSSIPLGTVSIFRLGTKEIIDFLSESLMATTLSALFQILVSQYLSFKTSIQRRGRIKKGAWSSTKCLYTEYSMVCSTMRMGILVAGIWGMT